MGTVIGRSCGHAARERRWRHSHAGAWERSNIAVAWGESPLTPLLQRGELGKSFLKFALAGVLLALMLLSGCARFNPSWPGKSNGDLYAKSDADELLSFGASLANKPAPARAEVCRNLRSRQKEAPGPGVLLHLMMGRTLSDSCGETLKILDSLDSPSVKNISDERVRWLV